MAGDPNAETPPRTPVQARDSGRSRGAVALRTPVVAAAVVVDADNAETPPRPEPSMSVGAPDDETPPRGAGS